MAVTWTSLSQVYTCQIGYSRYITESLTRHVIIHYVVYHSNIYAETMQKFPDRYSGPTVSPPIQVITALHSLHDLRAEQLVL